MRMHKAQEIIKGEPRYTGFMVSFEEVKGRLLHSDHFPDRHAGEPLISSESEAWAMAQAFASKTRGKYVNIYVVDVNFSPVQGYAEKMIKNRDPA